MGCLQLCCLGVQESLVGCIALGGCCVRVDQVSDHRQGAARGGQVVAGALYGLLRVRCCLDRAAARIVVDRLGGAQLQASCLVVRFCGSNGASLLLVTLGGSGKDCKRCGDHRFLVANLHVQCLDRILQRYDRAVVIGRSVLRELVSFGLDRNPLGQVVAVG